MWFNFDIFGMRQRKRLRELDAAIALAARLADFLAAARAGPAINSAATAFMAAAQTKSLLELTGDDLRKELLREGSPFQAAFNTPQWIDIESLSDAVNGLWNLLQSKRDVLRPQAPQDPDPQAFAGVAASAAAGPVRPDEASILWTTTEKLYASWPIRAIVLLVVIAIAIAFGGSFVIGNQTLNMRKNLDDALEKAQTEIRAISAATQTRVADESKTVLDRLHERGTVIDGQLQRAETEVAALEAGSNKIKAEIIAKLQEDLKAQETSLKDEIVKPLIKIRDEDLKDINSNLGPIRKSVEEIYARTDEQKSKLDTLTPKLTQLSVYAKQSDEIGTGLSKITTDQEAAHASRLSAESEAHTAKLQRQAAETSAASAETLRGQTGGAVKTASEEAIKYISTLGGIGQRLNDLEAKLSADVAKEKTDVAAEEGRLKEVKGLIDKLEKDAQSAPPKAQPSVEPPAKPKTLADLTTEDKKQIQSRLADQGLYDRPIDGKFGKQTTIAIRAYQKKKGGGTEVSGELTTEQIADLLKPK
jgi:hypothetical protein